MSPDKKPVITWGDRVGKPAWSALIEILFLLLFSTISFTLGALALLWLSPSAGYFDMLSKTFENGELWIFATAFLGPSILLLGKDSSEFKPPKWRGAWLVVVSLALIVCSFGFAFSRSVSGLGASIDLAVKFSYFLAALAVIVRWFVLVIYNIREKADAAREYIDDQGRFLEEYQARKGGK